MQNWQELYNELCTKIEEKVPAVKWQDLWHNQVNFLSEEHPFPTPSLFYAFRINDTTDSGEKTQLVGLQVMVYVFFETFADTYKGSWNQQSALDFLTIINDVYAALHGTSGTNYSEMRRIAGMAPVDTGGSGNLYQIPFYCKLVDYAAMKQWVDQEINEIEVERGGKPVVEPEEPLYDIP